MPRAQNSHACVNATFSFAVDASNSFTVTEKPTLVFGYIDSTAVSKINEANNLKLDVRLLCEFFLNHRFWLMQQLNSSMGKVCWILIHLKVFNLAII